MNQSEEVLAFSVGAMRVPARHDDKLVTREIWKSLLADVKSECAGEILVSFLSKVTILRIVWFRFLNLSLCCMNFL
jgi:hypothetical protein